MSYHVMATRVGHLWIADVQELSDARAVARTVPKLEQQVRRAIMAATGLAGDDGADIELVWEWRWGPRH